MGEMGEKNEGSFKFRKNLIIFVMKDGEGDRGRAERGANCSITFTLMFYHSVSRRINYGISG